MIKKIICVLAAAILIVAGASPAAADVTEELVTEVSDENFADAEETEGVLEDFQEVYFEETEFAFDKSEECLEETEGYVEPIELQIETQGAEEIIDKIEEDENELTEEFLEEERGALVEISASSMAAAIADVQQYTYIPYVWGAKPVSGYIYDEKNPRWGAKNADGSVASWDCSGFTQWFYYHYFGMDIGVSTDDQVANKSATVLYHKYSNPTNYLDDMSLWKAGDLFFFNDNYSHVAMYIGSGKFMHARSVSLGTLIEDWPLTVSSAVADSKSGKISAAVRFVNYKTELGSLRINKTDSASGELLNSAEFVLYEWSKGSNSYRESNYVIREVSKGIYGADNLEATTDNEGKFKVIEKKAPNMFYEIPTFEKEFIIKPEVNSTGVNECRNISLNVENNYFSFIVKLNKTDGDSKEPIKGVSFALLDSNKEEIKRASTGTTGFVTFSGLKKGTYYLREVEAPLGYEPCEDIKVELPKDAAEELIEDFYLGFFGRKADASGKNSFMNMINNGASEAEVVLGFINSSEYKGKNKSDADFIKDMYRALLGREAGISEVDSQVQGLIDAGSRDKFIDGFTRNTEAKLGLRTVYYYAENFMRSGSIKTVALDSLSDSHTATFSAISEIVDYVGYEGLIPGRTYTLKGILMDAETLEPIIENGEIVSSEKEFMAEEESGGVEMNFVYNSKALTGKKLVVFEYLFLGDKEITNHTDALDEDQTIYVPDIITSAFVNGEKEADAGKDLEIIDKIRFVNFEPGQECLIEGELIDKETGEPVAESRLTAIITEDVEEISLPFIIDGSKLGGTELVVTERLYVNELLAVVHENLENESQTIKIKSVEEPESETEEPETETNEETEPESESESNEETEPYEESESETESETERIVVAVQTGDDFPIDNFIALMAIAGGIGSLVFIKKKFS